MLELPSIDPTNAIKLADWMELNALAMLDNDSSRGDLESALRVAAFGEVSDDNQIETKILDVFSELELREGAASGAYPFKVEDGVLSLKSTWKDYPVYCFCLCLSYFGLPETKVTPKLFEQVSCSAAKNYLKGRVIGFGFPRKDLSSGFSKAITELCKLLGEGGQFKEQKELDRKDDTLDLVAWVDFVDELPSKVIMFGQCAAGGNWEDKISELNAEAFWGQWMRDSAVSPITKSFFIPHRVESDKWEFIGRKAGIIFDRCRIAHWAHQAQQKFPDHVKWIEHMLKSVN